MKRHDEAQIKVSGWRQLLTLTAMQLRARIDLSFLHSPREIALKIGKTVIVFALATACVYGSFFIVKSLLSFQIDVNILALLLGIMLVSSFITCLSQLSKSLYESKDRIVLLNFPVHPNMVFFSKIIVAYIQELFKNLNFFGSVIIAFGIINHSSGLYYLSCVWIYFLLPLILVSVCSLLSIPFVSLKKLFGKSAILKIAATVAVMGILGFLILQICKLVPGEILIVGQWAGISEAIITALCNFAAKTWFFLVIARAMTLDAFGVNIGIILSMTVGCLALSCLVSRWVFLKLAAISTNERERRKEKIRRVKENKDKSSLRTLVGKEVKLLFKNFDTALSTYVFVLLSPFLILLLNTIYAAIPVSGLGRSLQFGFNLIMITLLSCTSSTSCASAFSNEGGNISVLKSSPVNPVQVGFSKILINMTVNTAMIILCWVTVSFKLTATPIEFVLAAWSSVLISISHTFWSLDMDLLHPEFFNGRDEGNKSLNSNIVKSLFIGMILCGLLGLITILVARENFNLSWIILFLISLLLFFSRLYLCVNRLKIYFKRI